MESPGSTFPPTRHVQGAWRYQASHRLRMYVQQAHDKAHSCSLFWSSSASVDISLGGRINERLTGATM